MAGEREVSRYHEQMWVYMCVLWQDRAECVYKLRQEPSQGEEVKINEIVTMTDKVRS